MPLEGIILNIQRFTIHDGPGIRTELFLKGCPLRCDWCSNPESQIGQIQLGVYKTKCISRNKCGGCEKACPQEGILKFTRGKLTAIDSSKCNNCLACYHACPSDAIKLWGSLMSVEECMTEIRKDKGYFDRSGGGVTVSGGEPLLQSDFVEALFKACKEEGIQTCLESTFHVDWNVIEKIRPYTDIMISDIKQMDTTIHKRLTGVNNAEILENLKRLTDEKCQLILRMPIIPDVNDGWDNIEATADFILDQLGGQIRVLQLLSFMHLGEEKCRSLGMPYKMGDVKINRRSFQKHVNELADYFNRRGIYCQVGTKEKQ